MPFCSAFSVLLRSLKQDNGNGVVKYGLSEDDSVQLGIDFVGVENGQDRHWIRGREGSADGHGFDKRNVQAFERYTGPEVEDDAKDDCGNKSASKCKGQDGTNVAEKIALDLSDVVIRSDGKART